MDCMFTVTLGVSIRALAGRATYWGFLFWWARGVSIRALAGRATAFDTASEVRRTCFNPRPRREGDTPGNAGLTMCWSFNPRPRREGDSFSARV